MLTIVGQLGPGLTCVGRHRPTGDTVLSIADVIQLTGLASLCHEQNVPLIVDEAHGGHFGMDPHFPKSAMQQGADVAVQSSHKTMVSLGQSSMLHLQGQLVDPLKISQSLNLLHVRSHPG